MSKKLIANTVALILLTLAALGSGYAQRNPLPATTNSSPATMRSRFRAPSWQERDPLAHKWAWP